MATPIKLGALIRKQPKDIVAAFEAKGLKISGDWHEIWQEAHAKAFTVANVAKSDILLELKAEMERAKALGISKREFVNRLKPRMKALGWWGETIEVDPAGKARRIKLGSPYRLKFIYRQNMQSGYMAARWKAQKENADARPYWQYVAVLDSRTRPGHRALNGKVFLQDDPFWDSFYPPNGWNCRCRVRTLSERRLKAKGLSVESSAGKIGTETRDIAVNKRTGEVTRGKVKTFSYTGPDFKRRVFRPDAGWSYNPGSATYGSDVGVLRKLTAIDDVGIRAQAIQAINNSDLRHTRFANWTKAVLQERVARSTAQVVGIMDDEVADAARAHSQEPVRVMVLSDQALLHADRKLHHDLGVALTPKEWQALPVAIAKGDVYWDVRHKNIVFAINAGDKKNKIIVEASHRLRRREVLDAVINGYKVSAASLDDAKMFELIRKGKKL